jgi:hypothetical protein
MVYSPREGVLRPNIVVFEIEKSAITTQGFPQLIALSSFGNLSALGPKAQ